MTSIRRAADGGIEAFLCRSCNEWHDGHVDSLGVDEPDFVYGMSEADRAANLTLTPDQCILKQGERTDYFIRGCIELEVTDGPGPFTFIVWSSLSEQNFNRAQELWEQPGREEEEPYFGWLCTRLPGYPDTMLLKTWVRTRPVGQRPLLEVFEPAAHPLVRESQDGITTERVAEILQAAMHPE
jgi:hypothetical protein